MRVRRLALAGVAVAGIALALDFAQAARQVLRERGQGGCTPDCKCKCGQITCGCHTGR